MRSLSIPDGGTRMGAMGTWTPGKWPLKHGCGAFLGWGISLPPERGAAQAGRGSPRPSRGLPGACSGPVGQCHATELLCMEEKYLVTGCFLYCGFLWWLWVRQSGWALASLLHSSSIKQREKRGTHSSASQGAEDKHIKLCHAVRCCVCAGTCKIASLESQPLLLSNQQDRSDYVSPFASFRNRLFPPGWGGREEAPLLCSLHWRQKSPSDELQVQTGLHLFTRNCCQGCCDGASQSTSP